MLTAAVVGTMLPVWQWLVCWAIRNIILVACGMAGYTERQEIKGDAYQSRKRAAICSPVQFPGDCVLGNGQSEFYASEIEKNRSVSPAASTGIATG